MPFSSGIHVLLSFDILTRWYLPLNNLTWILVHLYLIHRHTFSLLKDHVTHSQRPLTGQLIMYQQICFNPRHISTSQSIYKYMLGSIFSCMHITCYQIFVWEKNINWSAIIVAYTFANIDRIPTGLYNSYVSACHLLFVYQTNLSPFEIIRK